MRAAHWQLRGQTSYSLNAIYYCHCYDVIRLDPIRRTREIVTSLPFEPRCLTAIHGWICAGAEQGDFATISVCESSRRLLESGAAIDARFDIDDFTKQPSSRTGHSNPSSTITATKPHVSITKIGKELVNCITIWFPERDLGPETYKLPVAVLSNNDKTVTVVDLQSSDAIQTIHLNDPVNRAVISPDGQLLVAVGDGAYMHVFVRETVDKDSLGPRHHKYYHWVENERIRLPGQQRVNRRGSDETMKGTFALAFSPTGRYLAVGTQYGVIQVFDTRLLVSSMEDPVVATCSSSRPHTRPGAIRTLEFSSGSIDLLAVTEDSGRAFILDARDGFKSRQIIELDHHDSNILRVAVTERLTESNVDPRLRSFQTSPSSSNLLTRPLDPLTAEETAVLSALRTERTRREESTPRHGTTDNLTDPTSDIERDDPPTLPQSLRDFVSGRNSTDTLRAFIAERNQDRERRGQPPRRRGSAMPPSTQMALALDGDNLDRERVQEVARQRQLELESFRERHREMEQERVRMDNRRENNQTRQQREADVAMDRDLLARLAGSATGYGTGLVPRNVAGSDSPNSPWAELEALYSITVDTSVPPVDPSERLGVEIASTNDGDGVRRLYWNRATGATISGERTTEVNGLSGAQQPRHFVRLGLAAAARSMARGDNMGSRDPRPMDTMGVSWHKDGRIL